MRTLVLWCTDCDGKGWRTSDPFPDRGSTYAWCSNCGGRGQYRVPIEREG